jgi:hypothetical protein
MNKALFYMRQMRAMPQVMLEVYHENSPDNNGITVYVFGIKSSGLL